MLSKHKRHKPGRWLAASAAFVMTLSVAGPFAAPVYAAGDTGGASTVQTAYTGFSAVSDVKVNNVSVKRYGHYNLSFDANGGSGSMSDVSGSKLLDDRITLTNKYTKTGYTFTGWDTARDGSGRDYKDGENVTADSLGVSDGGSVTLYAQWRANSYTIHFDKNASEAKGSMPDQAMTYDSTESLLSNRSFSYPGHAFAGWALSSKGDKKYDNMDAVVNLTDKPNGSVTLYAVWVANGVDATDARIDPESHTHIWVTGTDEKYVSKYHWQYCSVCGMIDGTQKYDSKGNLTGVYSIEGTDDAWKKTHAHDFEDLGWTKGTANDCDPSNVHEEKCKTCGYLSKSHVGQKKHNPFKPDGSINWATNKSVHVLYCYDCHAGIGDGTGMGWSDFTPDDPQTTPEIEEIRAKYAEDMTKYPEYKNVKNDSELPYTQRHIIGHHHDKDGNPVGGAYPTGVCAVCGGTFAHTYGDNMAVHYSDYVKNGNKYVNDSNDTWAGSDVDYSVKKTADGTLSVHCVIRPDTSKVVPTGTYADGRLYTYERCTINSGKTTISGNTITMDAVITIDDKEHNNSEWGFSTLIWAKVQGVTQDMMIYFEGPCSFDAPEITSFTSSTAKKSGGWSDSAAIHLSGTEPYYHNVSVTVKDGEEVIEQAQVPVSNGKWNLDFTPVLTASANGKTLTATVTNISKWSDKATLGIDHIDAEAPTIVKAIDQRGKNPEWAKSRTVTAEFTDNGGSGVDKIGLNTNNDMQAVSDGKRTFVFTGEKYDDEPYELIVTDKVGNSVHEKIWIGKIDNTAPTIDSTVIKGSQVTVTFDDLNTELNKQGSGVVKVGYMKDGSTKAVMTNLTDAQKSAGSTVVTINGTGKYLIVAEDAAGNRSKVEHVTINGGNASQSKSTIFDWGDED